jgi:branched-subunit amino acid ABC-type transport system permease component
MFDVLIEGLLATLLIGSLYTLMALGITLTYSVSRFANFSHGEFSVIGMYIAVVCFEGFKSPFYLSLPLAFLVPGAVLLAAYNLVYRPLEEMKVSPILIVVSTFAVAIGLRYGVYIWVDSYSREVGRNLLAYPPLITKPLTLFYGYTIADNFVLALAVMIILTSTLHFFLCRTKTGRAIRAIADNVDLARSKGIKASAIKSFTWFIAGGLAGVGGVFWATYTTISPEAGWLILLKAFAAAIIGGMVSVNWTIAGAFIISFSENVLMRFIWLLFGVSLAYQPLIAFLAIAIVLLIRPQGLIGLRLRRA